jgi:hemolysin activation/secretion protein
MRLGAIRRLPLVWMMLAMVLHGAVLAQPAGPQAQAGGGPLFDILEFVVLGDTLLGTAAIERAVYPFLGPGRSVADAEGARKALEKAYQDAGYLSVAVVLPEQTVGAANGEVVLQVAQARVDQLRVTGARFTLPSEIKAALPSLAPGQTPNFNDVQIELSALGRKATSLEITPLLSAGDRAGTLNVELKVQDSLPIGSALELNNKQALDTQAGRLEASVSFDNLWQRRHVLGLSWIVSTVRRSESDIQLLSYQLPLGGDGDRLSLQLTRSDSDIRATVGGNSVSRGQTWRLRWRDQLPTTESVNHGLTWGLTLRDLQDASVAADGGVTRPPALRYSTLQLAYDLALDDGSGGRSSALQAEFNAGLPGLNRRTVDCYGTPREQFACKRAEARPGFQLLTLGLSHRERLGRWSASARLQAQWADTPLVSSEQAVYGGQDSARGYYEGEQAGDLGGAVRLELTAPTWAATEGLQLTGWVFHDQAWLRRLYSSAEERAAAQLASAGIGLRLSVGDLRADLVWARVLRDTTRLQGAVQVPVSGEAARRRSRWDLNLRQSF